MMSWSMNRSKRINWRGGGSSWNYVLMIRWSKVNRRLGLVNYIGLLWKVSSVCTKAEAISDIMHCVSVSIGPDITVIATHYFIWPIAGRLLFHFNCIVRFILIAVASIGSTIVRRMYGTSVCIGTQIRWHLELVIPTIYIMMPRLTVTRRIITIESVAARWMKQQCNEWWPEVLLKDEIERKINVCKLVGAIGFVILRYGKNSAPSLNPELSRTSSSLLSLSLSYGLQGEWTYAEWIN